MDFSENELHQAIREGVRAVCKDFPDDYWSDCDERHEFPWAFYKAMAESGWVGICVPDTPDVDLVLGTQKFHRAADYLDDILTGRQAKIVDTAPEPGSGGR